MIQIQPITPEQYSAFGKNIKNWNFLNCEKQYQRFLNDNRSVLLLGGFENGEMKAAAMVLLQSAARIFREAFIPRGFLLDWNNEELIQEFSNALKSYLASEKVLYISMSPYLAMQERDENGDLVEGVMNDEAAADYLRKAGWTVVRAKQGYDETQDASWMSVLDLRGKTADQLLKEMDQQTRWSINRAGKFDLIVEKTDSWENLEAFAKMMKHTGERNGFHTDDADYYKKILDAFQDQAELVLCWFDAPRFISSQQKLYDQAKADLEVCEEKLAEMPNSKKFVKKKKVSLEAMELAEKKMQEAKDLEAKHGSRILLAGSLFLSAGNEMTYLTSGAYGDFMQYNAPYLIHMHQIRKAIERGLDFYNFYGISGYFHKDEPGYSLFAFKKGFGCKIVELMGQAYLPVRPAEFALYNKLKKIC